MKSICVYAEYVGNKIKPVFYELLGKAWELTNAMEGDTEICAIVLGENINSFIEELKESGVDKVYFMDNEKLGMFNIDYYSAAIVQMVKDYSPYCLLIGATPLGEELAPTVGLKLKTGVAAHCTDLSIREDGELVQVVPAFGGKVLGEILTPYTNPKIASVKPGIFVATKLRGKSAEPIAINCGLVNDTISSIKAINICCNKPVGLPLEEADIVVCGGFGIGSNENWLLLDELAVLLEGAVGCTRPALDEGWIQSEDNMIGTSGKSIRPKIYIGVGISGATHHICGMKDSDLIISINKDLDADIFKASNYKIVGDGKKFLESLIREIKSKEAHNVQD